MLVAVTNAQRRTPVDLAAMRRLAGCAARRLNIRGPGTLAITFLDAGRMRTLNRRFLGSDRATDVLSFRYDGEPACLPKSMRRRQVAGEIFIAPGEARRYARAHGLTYREELGRYVVHGLLHWLGHDDRTAAEQRAMRRREDRLLATCRKAR